MKAFLDQLECGKIKADALIIESLDRLSRDEVGDALTLFLNILTHGIRIITTKPEYVFDRKSINDPANLIMAILEICRGFSESNMKSDRVADAWSNKKKNARTGHKVSSMCPGWLKLVGDTFEFVPEKVAAVRRLIKLAKSGIGIDSITKTLNKEKLPTLKDFAKHWHSSSVHKTLNNRALIGEYQPKFANKNLSQKDRKADGLPIPNYYPALITETEFYELQAGLQSRRQIAAFGSGRQSPKVSNLFGNLLKDARSGSTLCRVDKGAKSIPTLMSSEVKSGVAKRETFPYEDFESHFLLWLKEVSLKDLASTEKLSQAHERLIVVRGKIDELTKKLKTFKSRLTQEDDIEILLDLVKELDTELKMLRKEEEVLKVESSKPDTTKQFTSITTLLDQASGDELIQLRSRLRFLLCEIIETIFIRLQKDKQKRRWLFAQIHFRNGLVRKMSMMAYMTYGGGGTTNPVPALISTSVSTPQQILDTDLRQKGLDLGGALLLE